MDSSPRERVMNPHHSFAQEGGHREPPLPGSHHRLVVLTVAQGPVPWEGPPRHSEGFAGETFRSRNQLANKGF
jgi:hypothetical protein